MSDQWLSAERITLPARRGVAGNTIGEIELEVHIAGRGPAVVLAHGFPELAYSWRYQIQPLVDAGFTVIAPNQRGYAGSGAPSNIEQYDLEHLTADLTGLLDAFEIEKAVFIGHDWGGALVWAMPSLYPTRTAGVVGVNTPYMAFPGTDAIREIYRDTLSSYVLWFQEPGVAESVLDERAEDVIDKLYRRMSLDQARVAFENNAGKMNPFLKLDEADWQGEPLLSQAERSIYVSAFRQTGFRGGVNWYRNLDRNRHLFPDIGTHILDLPCLMIVTDSDAALPPGVADGMKDMCTNLSLHLIENCGHWTQQEQPAVFNEITINWLKQYWR